MKKIILTVVLMSIPFMSFAHEDHDKTPDTVAAPHGGIMKDLKHIYLELLVDTGGIKIYPYDHDLKPVVLKNVKMEGTARFPKKAKTEKVAFTTEDGAFSAKVDAKGAHRYSLEVTVTHQGKKEKTKFNVEP